MDAALIELAEVKQLSEASRRLDQIIFRQSRSCCISNKALNNIWMFLHHVEIVPDVHKYKTASVNLKENKIIINRRFLLDYIKSFDDLAFIVLRERHHIALRYLHAVDISRILRFQDNVNLALQNIMEDTYINGIVRSSIDTDLPERFYGYSKNKRLGMERWLMHPKFFDNYKPAYDFYAEVEEINIYSMLCNIYKYKSNSVVNDGENISFKQWVQMAYPYFSKYLHEDGDDRSNEAGESEFGDDNNDDNLGKKDNEVNQYDDYGNAAGGDDELKSDSDDKIKANKSEDFQYQPISESGYDSPQQYDEEEEQQLKEQAGYYNKTGNGAYLVSTGNIVPKTMDWDACLITKTSDTDPLDLNAQVMLDTNIIDGFQEAANGLVVQAPHTDKQMPFTYMPYRVSRRDVFSLGMGIQPIFWQHYVEDIARKHYNIYFDVSESMSNYIGYLPCLLKALRNVDFTVYNFSRCVVEIQIHLCDKYYIGSGGTSFKAVGEHMLDNKVTHAFVLTDGCGFIPEDIMPALDQQLLDLILIKMGESPQYSEWDILANQVVELGQKTLSSV